MHKSAAVKCVTKSSRQMRLLQDTRVQLDTRSIWLPSNRRKMNLTKSSFQRRKRKNLKRNRKRRRLKRSSAKYVMCRLKTRKRWLRTARPRSIDSALRLISHRKKRKSWRKETPKSESKPINRVLLRKRLVKRRTRSATSAVRCLLPR